MMSFPIIDQCGSLIGFWYFSPFPESGRSTQRPFPLANNDTFFLWHRIPPQISPPTALAPTANWSIPHRLLLCTRVNHTPFLCIRKFHFSLVSHFLLHFPNTIGFWKLLFCFNCYLAPSFPVPPPTNIPDPHFIGNNYKLSFFFFPRTGLNFHNCLEIPPLLLVLPRDVLGLLFFLFFFASDLQNPLWAPLDLSPIFFFQTVSENFLFLYWVHNGLGPSLPSPTCIHC